MSDLSWQAISTVERRDWKFLWPGRLAYGTVTILDGRTGLGKSSLAAAICASLAGGPRLPGQKGEQGGASLWCSGEEDYARAVRPRLEAARANLHLVGFLTDTGGEGGRVSLKLPGGAGKLAVVLRERHVRFCVLDPLASHVDMGVSMSDEQQARAVMEALASAAEYAECAILCIRHPRKSTQGPVQDHGSGSHAILATARSGLAVHEHPDKAGWRVLSQTKPVYGPLAPSLAFSIAKRAGSARIVWHGQCEYTADQLGEFAGDRGERDERVDARELLAGRIGTEWVRAKEIMKEATEAGIGERRLRAAKAELAVRSRRVSAAGSSWWEWGPPAGGWPKGIKASVDVFTVPDTVQDKSSRLQGCKAAEGGVRPSLQTPQPVQPCSLAALNGEDGYGNDNEDAGEGEGNPFTHSRI